MECQLRIEVPRCCYSSVAIGSDLVLVESTDCKLAAWISSSDDSAKSERDATESVLCLRVLSLVSE